MPNIGAIFKAGFKDTGKNIAKANGPISAFVGFWVGIATDMFKAITRVAGWASFKGVEGAGRGAVWMVKQPVIGVGRIAHAAGGFAWKHKGATALVAAGTGAVMLANRTREQAAVDTQQQLMAQAMGGQPAGNSAYGAPVTLEEYAAMEAKMKQGGQGTTGHADAIAAQREAAAAAGPQTAPAV